MGKEHAISLDETAPPLRFRYLDVSTALTDEIAPVAHVAIPGASPQSASFDEKRGEVYESDNRAAKRQNGKERAHTAPLDSEGFTSRLAATTGTAYTQQTARAISVV